MSHDLLEPVRRHRRRAVASLAVLAAAATGLVVAPQLASAAPPVAVVITAGPVTSSVAVPATPDKYAPFVIKGVDFSVHFAISAALSSKTTFALTVDSGPDKGLVLGTYDMPKDGLSGDIDAATGVPTAANNVSLKVSAKGTTPGTTKVDVVSKFVTSTGGLTGIGAGGGVGVPCAPTSTPGDQTCGDLVIPAGITVPAQLLTQGLCTADCRFNGGSVLQWLATLPGVDNTHPVTFIAKCDKSLCAGKGVSSYSVKVQTNLALAPAVSQPCAAKGVVDPGKEFCTDYVQSKRDGAGDVLLVVLFAADAKIIW